jgi:Cd2+/Zn2+-exporting ATPase
MKLPIQDNISFLLSAVTIVVIVLEILSIIGLDIPMPYALFSPYLSLVLHTVLLNGVKQFSNLNLAASIY